MIQIFLITRLRIDDFNEHYGTNYESEHSVTFSGYVIEEFEKMPQENDEIKLNGHMIKVLHVSNNRINSLLVVTLAENLEENEE